MSKRLSSLTLKRPKGFTLIELLIVITIIGILAVALLPRISSAPAKARDVKRKADLNNLATAIELYYSDEGAYPASTSYSGLAEDDCLNSSSTIGKLLLSYTQDIPSDPGTGSVGGCTDEYFYVVMPYAASASTASSFALAADLELDDEDGDTSGSYCNINTLFWTNFDTASSNLQASTCSVSSSDAVYVILR